MSRPVVTAILLDELYKAGEQLRLVKTALITPAARDWIKEHPVPITWLDGDEGKKTLAAVMDPTLPELRSLRTMLDRKGGLVDVIEPTGGRRGVITATRQLCGKIARKEVTRGVVFAPDGAMPVCVANKHNGIRAALGMNIPAVEEACRELGINVLVIEYQTQAVYAMRQMIERMMNGASVPRPDTAVAIEDIEQGGGRADW